MHEEKTISVPADPALYNAIQAEADRRGWSKAQYCREALRIQVMQDQKQKSLVLPK